MRIVSALLNGRVWKSCSSDISFASPLNGKLTTLRGIDKTEGVEVFDASLGVATLKPMAWLRKSDLVERHIDNGDLEGTVISMNGTEWRVKTAAPKPNLAGEDSGLVYLILSAK